MGRRVVPCGSSLFPPALSLPLAASLPRHMKAPTHPFPEQTHRSGRQNSIRVTFNQVEHGTLAQRRASSQTLRIQEDFLKEVLSNASKEKEFVQRP